MARAVSTGAILEYATPGSPLSFTEVAFVTQANTPTPRTPEIDGTALSDTAAVIFLGITDFGETTMNFFVDLTAAAQFKALVDFMNAKTELVWRITWPISVAGNATNSTDEWNGRVSSVSRSADVQGMITGSLTIRATGIMTTAVENT